MSLSPATYTKSGTKATVSAKLDKAIFDADLRNHQLLQAAYVTYLANGRENLAVTKTRGLVRGGGKKPWKQKGTGRARFGSSRVPIWRGGGITFGPTGNENYSKRLSTTSKRQAVRQALSTAAQADKIKVVENLTAMAGKTKDMAKFLEKISAVGNVLCVTSKKDPQKERGANNIAKLNIVSAQYLNVYSILNADTIVLSKDSLEVISNWLGNTKQPKSEGEDE